MTQTTPEPMHVIVGLGNPGDEYSHTRHNAGFWVLDLIAAYYKGHWSYDKTYQANLCKVQIGTQTVWLLKPNTFMNRSGQAVGPLMHFYKFTPENLLVVHDELDILPGEVRLKLGGGNGGHNGLKDIQAHLGSPNYWRLRIGIGHPRSLQLKQEVVNFVLQRPSKVHQQAIDEAMNQCLIHIPNIIRGDKQALEQAIRQLHGLKGLSISSTP